jgi:hypothetical protein
MNDVSSRDIEPRCETRQRETRSVGAFISYDTDRLTRTNCTDPQKQVAVASSSVDQPSLDRLTMGKPWSLKEVMTAYRW